MPNICTNNVTVSGPLALMQKFMDEQIEVYVAPGETDPVYFTFQTVLPRPTSLDITCGSDSSNAYDVYFKEGSTLLTYPWIQELGLTDAQALRDWADTNHPTWKKLSQQMAYNFATHGHPTWYEWSIENWGTKWDAGDSGGDGLSIDSDGTGCLTIYFDTAWGPPSPVLDALAMRYAGLRIENSWEEEGGSQDIDTYFYDEQTSSEDDSVLLIG